MEPYVLSVISSGFLEQAYFVAAFALLAVLSIIAVPLNILTKEGSLAAFAFGALFLFVGGVPYLALMVFFVTMGALVTRYGLSSKKAKNVGEGKKGERGLGNVLAHVLVPGCLILLLIVPGIDAASIVAISYASTVSFGAADTFASEIGVLSPNPVSIVGWRRVEPGVNGGVSALGEVAALAGSVFSAIGGAVFFYVFQGSIPYSILPFLLLVTIAGWVGCQVDSLLGETVENRGILGKNGVNLISMLFSGVLAIAVVSII